MAVNRYRIALNNARFPFISSWGARAVVVPSADTSSRQPRQFQGSDENIDFNLAQVLYGENFVPVAGGLKSVSYVKIDDGLEGVTDFDQIFPLRDEDENTVLYSPSKGKNYVLTPTGWVSTLTTALITAEGYTLWSGDPALSKVTRAYVEGKTFVCYSRLAATNDGGVTVVSASLFYWDPVAQALVSELDPVVDAMILALGTAAGIAGDELDGIASSNGYLIIWSGLKVAWAPYNGTAFDFRVYANGEVTGAGFQVPEDVKGPITAITPVARGFIIWTTKNAVAAIYNANNFASPWIFSEIKNCGGVESFEQVSDVGGNKGDLYAYTTSGMQQVSLNSAESVFPDATDFLGARIIERFNEDALTFETGTMSLEMFVKVAVCANRFLVLSYGTYPGIYGFALVYDSVLDRWGKLRIIHRDCFAYSYGSLPADITYSMLGDVPYEMLDAIEYDALTLAGGNLTYPRQSIAFMLENGEIDLAVMDEREPDTDTYPSFVLLGRNQLSRSKLVSLQSAEIEGAAATAEVAALTSDNGATYTKRDTGYLREAAENYTEWGFDLPTGKNFTLFIKGQFHLSTVMLETVNDGNL